MPFTFIHYKQVVPGATDHRVVLLALSESEVRGTGRFGRMGSLSVSNTNTSPLSTKKKTHFIVSEVQQKEILL